MDTISTGFICPYGTMVINYMESNEKNLEFFLLKNQLPF